MKAIRVEHFGGPEVLKLTDVPDPQPAESQLLIRVRAIGVNPVDTYIRSGSNPNLSLPYTPGFDAVGTVQAVGSKTTGFAIGDRVYTSHTITGAYAEMTVADAFTVFKLPEKISFTKGAAINIPYATAYRALFQRAKARIGETVLIHGASGGVGLAAVQWARAANFQVIGTAGSDEGRILVLNEGAHHVLDHRATGYLEEVTRLTGGRGPDVILEMLANVNLAKDLAILAPHGRIVIIGSRGKIEITPRDAMSREADILGLMLFAASPAELHEIHAAIARGLEQDFLRPIVGLELPLRDAAKAHVQVLKPGSRGKIVLIP